MKGAKAMSAGGLYSAISSKTGQKPKDVKAVFTALQGIATSEVAKTEKFAIPQLVMIKLKHKPARPAGKRMMFGKEVKVAAKKASKVVKAFPPLRCGRCQSWSCHGVPRPQHRMVRHAVC